jgi:hypothetical protein
LEFQKELSAKKGDEDRVKAVERQCEEYKAQIAEMQVFLKGQGMIWKQGCVICLIIDL